MKNRRKHDNMDTHDLLVAHMQSDDIAFSDAKKRLTRIEIAIYAASTALALFIFLLDHPKIMQNLASSDVVSSAFAGVAK